MFQIPSRWSDLSRSEIWSHQNDCCRLARRWFLAMDRSKLLYGDLSSPPAWLKERFHWGPSAWPIYWCHVVNQEHVDCGVLAALCREIFDERQLVNWHVQIVQQYPTHVIDNWRAKWISEGGNPAWIENDIVYHETCALYLGNSKIQIWDPTDCSWLVPQNVGSYGAVVAVRVWTEGPMTGLSWEGRDIGYRRWTILTDLRHLAVPETSIILTESNSHLKTAEIESLAEKI